LPFPFKPNAEPPESNFEEPEDVLNDLADLEDDFEVDNLADLEDKVDVDLEALFAESLFSPFMLFKLELTLVLKCFRVRCGSAAGGEELQRLKRVPHPGITCTSLLTSMSLSPLARLHQ
jgi:hypothetical protein